MLVAGTRPEFIKLHPLALALARARIETVLITTQQHWSASMRDAFIEELRWPCPVEPLAVTAREPLALLAELFRALPDRLRDGDVVLVEGDTTSVLGAALVANKLSLTLGHVEAGLRSYDQRMPEEHNRRVVDHLADYLFAPTEADAEHLRGERCPGLVCITGNTVLDAVRLNAPRAEPPGSDGHVLVTLHRQENVDDPAFLAEIARFLRSVERLCLFPVHPRTEEKLRQLGTWDELAGLANVRLCGPMGYLAFLGAMQSARVIVTDSGGIQEEATAPEIRRPAIVLRHSTERMAAVTAGFSCLAPEAAPEIQRLVDDLSWFRPAAKSPFGDGHASEAIVAALAPVLEGPVTDTASATA